MSTPLIRRAGYRPPAATALTMPFDPARWPNAVRVRDLIAKGTPLEVHCSRCAWCRIPAELPLDPESYVPALVGRFRCTRCGSGDTEARPHYSRAW